LARWENDVTQRRDRVVNHLLGAGRGDALDLMDRLVLLVVSASGGSSDLTQLQLCTGGDPATIRRSAEVLVERGYLAAGDTDASLEHTELRVGPRLT
jgi:hypothetical protein